MPQYGAMTDAYYGRRANRINEGTARRGAEMEGMIKELAGAAAMGDSNSLQQLMQVDPQMGMQIRRDNDTRTQAGLSRSAAQKKDMNALLRSALEYAAQFDDAEEAKQGLQDNVDFASLPAEAQQGILQGITPDTLTRLKKGLNVESPEKFTTNYAEDGTPISQTSSKDNRTVSHPESKTSKDEAMTADMKNDKHYAAILAMGDKASPEMTKKAKTYFDGEGRDEFAFEAKLRMVQEVQQKKGEFANISDTHRQQLLEGLGVQTAQGGAVTLKLEDAETIADSIIDSTGIGEGSFGGNDSDFKMDLALTVMLTAKNGNYIGKELQQRSLAATIGQDWNELQQLKKSMPKWTTEELLTLAYLGDTDEEKAKAYKQKITESKK